MNNKTISYAFGYYGLVFYVDKLCVEASEANSCADKERMHESLLFRIQFLALYADVAQAVVRVVSRKRVSGRKDDCSIYFERCSTFHVVENTGSPFIMETFGFQRNPCSCTVGYVIHVNAPVGRQG